MSHLNIYDKALKVTVAAERNESHFGPEPTSRRTVPTAAVSGSAVVKGFKSISVLSFVTFLNELIH